MASIVVVTRFCESSGSSFNEYINYIDRDNATKRESLDKYNLFGDYIKYMENEEKTIQKHYEEGTEKVSSLFTKDKDNLSPEEKDNVKELFKKAQVNGSNMWQTVISFDNSYLTELGIYDPRTQFLNEKVLIAAGRKAISSMLEKEGLQNAIWTASFHYNTDNIHIHVATVEPSPMREKKPFKEWERNEKGKIKMQRNPETGRLEKIPLLNKDGNQVIRLKYKGKFKESSIKTLKKVLSSELDQDKESTIEITNMLRGIVNDKKEQQFFNNPNFQKKMQQIYNEIKKTGVERRYWNYNQKNFAHIKPKIDDLSNLFIETYHSDDFNKIIAKIEEKEGNYKKVYGGDNDYKKNKLYDKKDGLYTRLGNAILKEIQNFDRSQTNKYKEFNFNQKNINKGTVFNKYFFENAMRRLRRSMQYNYTNWRNNIEHEKLEKEIESRGEEI